MSVIEVSDLHRDYETTTGVFRRQRKLVNAVRGVSFRVERGDLFGLLGPNGAGKTTIIKVLICSSPPLDSSEYSATTSLMSSERYGGILALFSVATEVCMSGCLLSTTYDISPSCSKSTSEPREDEYLSCSKQLD